MGDLIIEFETDAEPGVTQLSVFHLSCSDPDMNDPGDCGKVAGDGKHLDSEYKDVWQFLGSDEIECLDVEFGGPGVCDHDNATVANCTWDAPLGTPHCPTINEGPAAIDFLYTGMSCASSSNSQGASASCNGTLPVATIPMCVTVYGNNPKSAVTIPPLWPHIGIPHNWTSDSIHVGHVFTITNRNTGNKLEKDLDFSLVSAHDSPQQNIRVRTNCDVPLNLGDSFGGATVVGIHYSDGTSFSWGGLAEIGFSVTHALESDIAGVVDIEIIEVQTPETLYPESPLPLQLAREATQDFYTPYYILTTSDSIFTSTCTPPSTTNTHGWNVTITGTTTYV